MRFSILIAACGAGARLAEALAAVRAQSHGDWDVAVVAAEPDEGNKQLISDFTKIAARQAVYETLGPQAGIVAVRNRLLELATGDAIAFLDAEDAWTLRHLANAVQQFDQGVTVAVSDARPPEAGSGRPGTDITIPAQLANNPVRTLFARDVVPSLSCVALRREVVKSVKTFDPAFAAGEGREFLLRCALAGARFCGTHRATCRLRPRLATARGRALLVAENNVQFYDKYRDLSAVPAATRRRLLAASLVTHGRLLRTIEPARAARCFWRAWSLQPVHVQTLGQFALTGWRFTSPAQTSDVDTPHAS
jgi:glycosyltransferase involved in cell wall biosynthesis